MDDMDIDEVLKLLVTRSTPGETLPLADLVRQALQHTLDILAAAENGKQAWYLVFLTGIPEGALYIDRDGVRYGDTAAVRIPAGCRFTIYRNIERDLLEALVMGCRIYTKSHLTQYSTAELQELGFTSRGLGTITIEVHQKQKPAQGIRVDVKEQGKIVGSDYTSTEGTVSFRVMHGTYTCSLEERDHTLTSREILFDPSHPRFLIEL